jgi:hypothetical protein
MTALAAGVCAGGWVRDAPAPETPPQTTATIPIVFAVDNRLIIPHTFGIWTPGMDTAVFHGPISLDEANSLLGARRLAATLVTEANRLLGSHLGLSFAIADVKLWPAVGGTLESRLDDLRTRSSHAPPAASLRPARLPAAA